MGDSSFLTFDPSKEKPCLLRYDIQAVAAIIVTLKLIFKLDDHVEWYITSYLVTKGFGSYRSPCKKSFVYFTGFVMLHFMLIMFPFSY